MKKYTKILSLLLCAVLLLSLLPAASAAEAEIKLTSVTVSGFEIPDFSPDTTYYLCYPPDFNDIKFTGIKTNVASTYTISVERYCDCDVRVTYNKDEVLKLGYGRARVTLTVTSKADANNKKSYLFALTDPHQENYRYRHFRNNPTTVYETASEAKPLATLRLGTTFSSMPLCIGTSGNYTKIVIPPSSTAHHGKIGWVKTADLVEEYPIITPPQSYDVMLKALKKAHPNWNFEYRYMNVSMEDYINTVAKQTIANTSGTGTDKTQIANFMNPQNFFNEKNIFMFLDLSDYTAGDYTTAGVQDLWVSKSNAVCTEAQATKYLLDAAKSLRMNGYFIASRAAIESGYGTSNLSKGKPGSDGKLYYNFYGIGAYDSNPSNGTTYAQGRGWDTPYRSIVEGANWINDQYVQRGQNTPYFFRFYPYDNDHIYMSDLSAPRTESVKLYEAYKAAGKLDSKLTFIIPVYAGLSYTDVYQKDWFYEDVNRATEYGLFAGMKDGSFQPNQQLTRAQMVSVLARMTGEDFSGNTISKFTDVPRKAWYHSAVAWGYHNGVVAGVSDTSFAPEQAITRQELCTMLVRFAEHYNVKMPKAELTFTDTADIASWAKEGVAACVGGQLVAGMPGGAFCPKQNATRAQAARILSLFYEAYFFLGV